jgi:hypothetical protein
MHIYHAWRSKVEAQNLKDILTSPLHCSLKGFDKFFKTLRIYDWRASHFKVKSILHNIEGLRDQGNVNE